ncbi:hypothetical protein BH09MYX1_BH09MYX1_47810 [soil metagenome]
MLGGSAMLGALGACAQGTIGIDADAGVEGPDATTGDASGDASGCPQFNLKTDPQHCGSCTTACKTGEVCSSGSCKASCDSPTTKCTGGDGGVTCATLANDPDHCGQCTTACAAADAGSLQPGSNNPAHPGVNFDSGTGWNVGTRSCTNSQCGTTCGAGFTTCSDGVCYDTQNFHDHCGTCPNACAAGEWCNAGKCCGIGELACNGTCTDVLGNASNCGACGNVCSGGTPFCSGGVCTAGCNPSGTRQPFNTLASKTATGCFNTSPCATGNYSWSSANIQAFQALNQEMVCSGATACVGHVGINTYASSTSICHGTFDVYCDGTKVGTINSTGSACGGDPMTNGCSATFTPRTCSSIKLVLVAGTGVQCCLSSGIGPDTAISGVSAW